MSHMHRANIDQDPADQWNKLADELESMADHEQEHNIPTGTPDIKRSRAKQYRNLAESIRLGRVTGRAHCRHCLGPHKTSDHGRIG